MSISARSVENCTSVERRNTLDTDLQSILQNIKNLQPAKEGLFSLIPEAVVHMNFAGSLAKFFRTTILYYIDNYTQNIGVLKNFAKFMEKHLCWNLFLIKVQA